MLTFNGWSKEGSGDQPVLMSPAHDDDLAACRRDIDAADGLLLEALERRAVAVKHLAQVKRGRGIATYDPAREAHILARATDRPHTFPAHRRRAIFATIVQQMREWQVTLD